MMRRRRSRLVVASVLLIALLSIAGARVAGRIFQRAPGIAVPTPTEAAAPAATSGIRAVATATPIPLPPVEVARPAAQPTVPLPSAVPTAQPTACRCEEIVILSPTQGLTITSPVTVTGLAAGFERTVIITVLDGGGDRIGQATADVAGPAGQPGAFAASVPFAVPANSQPGRIQVWTESVRDAAVEHLSSVIVSIRGLELDPLLGRLDAAFRAGDYGALAGLMADPFEVTVYGSGSQSWAPAQAIEELRLRYVGPRPPRLDFSVDARKVLAGRVSLGANIVHLVYSAGWGQDGGDDALLLIGDAGGQARWSGLLYLPRSAIDHR